MPMSDHRNHNSPLSATILLYRKNILFNLIIITSILLIWSWLFLVRSSTDHSHTPPRSNIHHSYSINQEELIKISDQSHDQDTITSTSSEPCSSESSDSDYKQRKQYPGEPTPPLKVFMYDLPIKFHFGMLDWHPNPGSTSVWPDLKTTIPHYPGGLNLQHSIEYWLTLDILNSEFTPATAHIQRVHNSTEADVIFVPFFSSLSYNRYSTQNAALQDELVTFLESQPEWKRSNGIDHIILAHHPNSLLSSRTKLYPSIFILSDFGRYPTNVANIEKDIITPYKHVLKTYTNDTSTYRSRTTLLYFQGSIHRKSAGVIREKLYNILKSEPGVHFQSGSVSNNGIKQSDSGMKNSKYCLNIAGDTPSSNRLFDSIVSHCVPVIVSDEIELPFEDVVDYSEFCVFVRSEDAVKEGFVLGLVKGIGEREWGRMWRKLVEVEKFFEFGFPSREGDGVRMIWKSVKRKVRGITFRINRSRRHWRSNE